MYISPPNSLTSTWGRGVVSSTPVESLDLYPTLVELAGLPMPKMHLGGESMSSLLTVESDQGSLRNKTWALSQWPRHPSCTTQHHCVDGSGNPWEGSEDDASLMGYTLRTERWRYTAWFAFNWGENGDPKGEATFPLFDQVHTQFKTI